VPYFMQFSFYMSIQALMKLTSMFLITFGVQTESCFYMKEIENGYQIIDFEPQELKCCPILSEFRTSGAKMLSDFV
jgi:hypothetical protein